jgi:hypothetical protein
MRKRTPGQPSVWMLCGALALCMLAACGNTLQQSSTTADGGPIGADADAAIDADETGACVCQLVSEPLVGGAPALLVPWDCYCGQQPDKCHPYWNPSNWPGSGRVDYPECGLTVLQVQNIGGPQVTVFDADRHLVGVAIGGDIADYACPSEPSKHSSRLRSGRFPDASCRAVVCANGSDPSFPCAPPTDGGV